MIARCFQLLFHLSIFWRNLSTLSQFLYLNSFSLVRTLCYISLTKWLHAPHAFSITVRNPNPLRFSFNSMHCFFEKSSPRPNGFVIETITDSLAPFWFAVTVFRVTRAHVCAFPRFICEHAIAERRKYSAYTAWILSLNFHIFRVAWYDEIFRCH